MDYKKASSASNWLLGFSLVACGGAYFFEGIYSLIAIIVAFLLIVSAIVIRILFWRCPHCKKMITPGFRREPTMCPKCKKPLLKDDKTE